MAEVNGGKREIRRSAIGSKAIMPTTRKTVKEFLPGRAEMYIKVRMLTTRGMDMVKCTGPMARYTKVTG